MSTVTGAGPYAVTLVRALVYAHTAGEQLVINCVAGDTMLYSGLVTTDGGVPVTAGTTFVGPGTYVKTVSGLSRPITRGVWSQEFVIPTGLSYLYPYVQTAAGTGVTSFGQLGFYNLTRMGS